MNIENIENHYFYLVVHVCKACILRVIFLCIYDLYLYCRVNKGKGQILLGIDNKYTSVVKKYPYLKV